jgi:tetratricopeptide (TPR) repeat protein
MATEMSSFVERYQLLYEKDPRSKVFAPLAEAYRKMGLLDEAIDLASRGVQDHPNFASGRVALGKCYVQKAQFQEASEQLKIAAELSPENLLAHQLLAECYARLKKPVEALNAYKIVLFLNPNDSRVAEIVRKLEFQIYGGQEPIIEDGEGKTQSATEEEIEEFTMGRADEALNTSSTEDTGLTPILIQTQIKSGAQGQTHAKLEQELALLDSLYQKGDWGKVKDQLADLLERHPDHPQILGRKQYLDEITNNNYALTEWLVPQNAEGAPDQRAAKVAKLKNLLELVETRRKV